MILVIFLLLSSVAEQGPVYGGGSGSTGGKLAKFVKYRYLFLISFNILLKFIILKCFNGLTMFPLYRYTLYEEN